MNHKFSNYLGLAQRAGCLLSGGMAVRKALIHGTVKLLILAEDAASTTISEYQALAEKNNIPVLFYGQKEDIGQAIGKSQRFGVAVTQDVFAQQLKEVITSTVNDSQRESGTVWVRKRGEKNGET